MNLYPVESPNNQFCLIPFLRRNQTYWLILCIKMDEPVESDKRPVFRDIRRYFCEYCGICRSKKTLITSHINSHHKEEIEKYRAEGNDEAQCIKPNNTCQECGASFKKRAYLLQHMQSHSLEKVIYKIL